jgi:acyl-CoA reductase-like NAD-dependent aldehyde dehydrogenase
VFQGNDTTYGLAAAVWTRDVSRAFRVVRAIKAGPVSVNCYNNIDSISPFGGYKQSGIGREFGKHSLDLYTQIHNLNLPTARLRRLRFSRAERVSSRQCAGPVS